VDDALLERKPLRAWLFSRFEVQARRVDRAQPLRLATYKDTREDLDAIEWRCEAVHIEMQCQKTDVHDEVKHKTRLLTRCGRISVDPVLLCIASPSDHVAVRPPFQRRGYA
jgi:hypothetical protein